MPETHIITSRSNERLAHIRKVRDGKVPGQIFLEGLRLAEEAARSDIRILEAAFTPSFVASERGGALAQSLQAVGVAILEVADAAFKSVADTVNSQGIALIAARPEGGAETLERALRTENPAMFVYFHRTNDPSNIGAVLRTAEAAGVSGVIISEGSADAYSPKALRAGMGSNLRIPVWAGADPDECIAWARSRGIRIVATGVSDGKSYTNENWREPTLLIFGSEAHGLDQRVFKLADSTVTIPMRNGVESLNLAVSAGIILFEAARQNAEGEDHR